MREQLPEGWRVEPLRNVAQVVSGGTPSRNVPEFWDGGTIPWVTPTDVTATKGRFLSETRERITERGLQSCSAALLPAGTLLVTSRATLGEIRIAQVPVCTNQGFKSLVPLREVDGPFLYYQMLRSRERYQALGVGSTFLEVNKRDTERFEILRAPHEEQRRIAAVLTAVDEAIEQTEALIAKTQQVKAGLMHDLFTRGILPNGELRPTRSQAPQLYSASPLGPVPKEWRVWKIADIAVKVTDGDHHTPRRVDQGIHLLSARNILNGSLDLEDVDYVDEAEYARMIRRCHPEAGDILISCSGSIGRVCVVPDDFRCCLVRSAALVKLRPDVCDSIFVEQVLQSTALQTQIRSAQRQAAQPNLFQGEISSLMIALPPLGEQVVCATRLNALNTQISLESSALTKLHLLKRGIMHDLLTGRVRVPASQLDGASRV